MPALSGKLLLHLGQVFPDQFEDFLGGQDSDDDPSLAGRPVGDASSRKKRRKFAVVMPAISSADKSLTLANVLATSRTNAGSFLFPRCPCGGRKGESVSISSRSAGNCRATSRSP